jgi:hypothetical protein
VRAFAFIDAAKQIVAFTPGTYDTLSARKPTNGCKSLETLAERKPKLSTAYLPRDYFTTSSGLFFWRSIVLAGECKFCLLAENMQQQEGRSDVKKQGQNGK